MILTIKEKIKVAAVFAEYFPKPVWFIFNNEKIMIKEICYKWTERSGNWLNFKYTVTEGSNIFELIFTPENMSWRLEAINEGGYDGML